MLARLLLPTLLGLCLAPTASADKFYFGDPNAAEKMAAGSPDMVQGVLLRDENGLYVIRVEGGEISVPRESVYKIEKDGLTIADLERLEADIRDSLAAANETRIAAQAAERAARAERLREIRQAEAEAAEAAAAEAMYHDDHGHGLAPVRYDPILHRIQALGGDYHIAELVRQELGGILRARLRLQIPHLKRWLRSLPY